MTHAPYSTLTVLYLNPYVTPSPIRRHGPRGSISGGAAGLGERNLAHSLGPAYRAQGGALGCLAPAWAGERMGRGGGEEGH